MWPARYDRYTQPAWELSRRALNGRTNAIVTIRMVVDHGTWHERAGPRRSAERHERAERTALASGCTRRAASGTGPEHRLRPMATTGKDVEPAKTITVEERIDELRKRRKAALTPGGRDAAKKQHDRGKLTARERVELLMDRGPSWRPTPSPFTARTTSGWIASARPATAS